MEDYVQWLEQQATLIENQQAPDLALADEIRAQARRDKRALISAIERIVEHLIKLEYVDSESLLFKENQRGWRASVISHQQLIKKILKESPSLKNYLTALNLEEIVQDCLHKFSMFPEYANIENVREFSLQELVPDIFCD